MKIIDPSHQILGPANWHEGLRLIEAGARVCYKSQVSNDPEKVKRFVQKLLESGHETPFEHCSMTVNLITDRGVTHELVRHRLISPNQESTRYCRYKEGICVIRPQNVSEDVLRANLGEVDYEHLAPTDLSWMQAMYAAERAYLELLAGGWTPQEARSVLPNSLKTEIQITSNVREWRHIFKLRVIGTTGAPHPEIKRLLEPLMVQVIDECPVLFGDLKWR